MSILHFSFSILHSMMTGSTLDAAQCLLMAKTAARMHWRKHSFFWENLPDIVPDLTMHLPALIAAVRKESGISGSVLDRLSAHPLPAVLSPKTVGWRTKLGAVWENRLKAEREAAMKLPHNEELSNGYISALRGLTQVDQCGMPSGLTCPSVLPTLLNEVRDIQKRYMDRRSKPEPVDVYRKLKCFAVLADWRPARNIVTDTASLREWGNFWLELYQSEKIIATDWTFDERIIRKGLAAKALLNLMETGSEEETGVLAGMETTLLTSLARAARIAGMTNLYFLGWLNWHPQDVNRFPSDRLAELPETRLERIKFLCQKSDYPLDPILVQSRLIRNLSDALGELVRWEQSGLLAACCINLTDRVVTNISGYLNKNIRSYIPSDESMDYRLYRWLIRDKVAAVKEGRELLQKLENYWQYECQSKYNNWYSKFVAWQGRMELQCAGLATETSADFRKDLLEAIKGEKWGEAQTAAQMVLSLRQPDRGQEVWECLWQEQVKSDNDDICLTAALALLRPNPADDAVARRERLRDVLYGLPARLRPKLAVAEFTYLIEEVPPGKDVMDAGQSWQFKSDTMMFRLPTEYVIPPSTPITVKSFRPEEMDNMARRTGGR